MRGVSASGRMRHTGELRDLLKFENISSVRGITAAGAYKCTPGKLMVVWRVCDEGKHGSGSTKRLSAN
ncbi:hypothetical protein Pmani_009824 [Petrolisthes manimaculis]|uniref:Uncharacterized protein n=1 Tax=Petrolisthes manimaculis TaxID=1843537 RepID=A0AAE1Q665_9EUCA|nr:hypothetical protein Pmani_009824 [Petrolisthes manimaculis]